MFRGCKNSAKRRSSVQGLNLKAVNAEVDRRGFIPVNERMQVLDKSGKPLSSVYCIGDANGESALSFFLLHSGLSFPC